jgi:hyperosmotically inducible protein
VSTVVVLVTLCSAPVFAATATSGSVPGNQLEKKVRHQLNMLPFFTVFDYVTFHMDGTKVILEGAVSRPWLKVDAARAVKAVPGVTAVDNRIEALPASVFDDQIRRAEFRAIYGNSVLSRYALGPYGPIRIVVKNGNVILEGYVSSQMDKNIAGMQAGLVPGVFSVTNDLKIDRS